MHRQTDRQTHKQPGNNASSHYVGGGIKIRRGADFKTGSEMSLGAEMSIYTVTHQI